MLSFDTPPTMVGGRVLVPLRGIFEALGATVNYNPATRTVQAASGDRTVSLLFGSRAARVNGSVVMLDQPPMIIGGRTLVPLRFVSEALGADVKWMAATRTVTISSSGATGTLPPPGNIPPVAGAPQISSVTIDGNRNLRPGDVVTITAIGTPGGQATFDVVGVTQSQPMNEVGSGRYVGQFTLPRSLRDIRNAAVFVRLSLGGQEAYKAANTLVIRDGSMSIVRVTPEENSTVQSNRPNIMVMLDDSDGLRSRSVRLLVNGQDVTPQANVTDDFISYVPNFSLPQGLNTVRVTGRTDSGAQIEKQWSFNVLVSGNIQSVSHNATGPLNVGDVLQVSMFGAPGGIATFDIGSQRTNIPMQEVSPGRYVGTYRVQPSDNIFNEFIVARLNAPGQPPVVATSTTPVQLGGAGVGAMAVRIISPTSGMTVPDQFTIQGQTTPFASVLLDVKVSTGGFFQFQGNVLQTRVQANEQGFFSLDFRNNLGIRGGQYIITATSQDMYGRVSAPTTVTVNRQ